MAPTAVTEKAVYNVRKLSKMSIIGNVTTRTSSNVHKRMDTIIKLIR